MITGRINQVSRLDTTTKYFH